METKCPRTYFDIEGNMTKLGYRIT